MQETDLGNRMKRYENAWRIYMPSRLPVVIRVDGCHFHNFTKGMNKPFDEGLIETFWETGKYLAENIMGCKLVYHQSDELSILITNYDTLQTQSWFSNNLQKIVSVAASLATARFNQFFGIVPDRPLATFDARAWILPHDEVCNYFLWRQQDAARNSVSMVARANFPHGDTHGLNNSALQEKLFQEREINWDKLPTWHKRGACLVNKPYLRNGVTRYKWEVDQEIPLFSKDRSYINQWVYLETESQACKP